jgi:[ribosomal protein S5]-alanine N-acetyltransferase
MLPDRFETTRLILRPIEADDATAIFTGYAQDPEVVRFLIWRPHQDLAETEAYIAGCTAAPADRSRTYALIGRGDGPLLGAFALRRPEPHRLDCGYVPARRYWGRGLMTETLTEGGPPAAPDHPSERQLRTPRLIQLCHGSVSRPR